MQKMTLNKQERFHFMKHLLSKSTGGPTFEEIDRRTRLQSKAHSIPECKSLKLQHLRETLCFQPSVPGHICVAKSTSRVSALNRPTLGKRACPRWRANER